MKRPAYFLCLFLLASCVEILTPFSISLTAHLIAKPLILTSLIGYYLSRNAKPQLIFVLGLMACLAGDTFLLFETNSETYFMMGLVSFLIAHLCYSVSYLRKRWKQNADRVYAIQKIRLSLPVLLCGTGVIVLLYPALGRMRVPVIAYSTVLMTMALSALSRLGRTSIQSFWSVFAGAVLFMASDTILAINKFSAYVLNDNFLIMITYCAAQYLIVTGMILHEDSRPAADTGASSI